VLLDLGCGTGCNAGASAALPPAVRDRHDGVRRNPWNEAECGNHYARSLASWGVLIALTGAQWDASERSLSIVPRSEALRDAALRCFFSTATGWGIAAVENGKATLRLLGGTLDLAEELRIALTPS